MVDNVAKTLSDYIKKNLAKGYTTESLRFALLHQGYSRSLIEKAFQQVHKELSEQAPKVVEQPIIKTEVIEEHIELPKKSFWKRLFGLD